MEGSGKQRQKQEEQQDRIIGSVEQEEYEDIVVYAVMDSGAFDTICPLDMIGGSEIRQTNALKA